MNAAVLSAHSGALNQVLMTAGLVDDSLSGQGGAHAYVDFSDLVCNPAARVGAVLVLRAIDRGRPY